MKVCSRYYKDKLNFMKKVDEIMFKHDSRNDALEEFFEQYKDKRLICYVDDENYFEFFDKYLDIYYGYILKYEIDFALMFDSLNFYEEDNFNILREKKIKFFFDTHVDTIDKMWVLIQVGVSDMYITDGLGFSLEQIAPILHDKGITIRVFPNVCQGYQVGRYEDTLKSFFIRPEDLRIYEPYVDVYEFYGTRENIEWFYSIYMEDKKWFGNLEEMLIGYKGHFNNRGSSSVFGYQRSKCQQKCKYGKPCKSCEKLKELAEVMDKNKIAILENK